MAAGAAGRLQDLVNNQYFYSDLDCANDFDRLSAADIEEAAHKVDKDRDDVASENDHPDDAALGLAVPDAGNMAPVARAAD